MSRWAVELGSPLDDWFFQFVLRFCRVLVWVFGRKLTYLVVEVFYRVLVWVFGRKPAYPFVDWSLHWHEFAEGQGASSSSSHRQGATTSPSGWRAHTCWRRGKGHP